MKKIIVLFFLFFACVSCGMTYHSTKDFIMVVESGDGSFECVYDEYVFSRHSRDEIPCKPIIVTRDTLLLCPVDFSLRSSVGKDEIIGKQRYVTLRRLSGDEACNVYMVNSAYVEYKEETYSVLYLINNIIGKNDTSIMTKDEFLGLLKESSVMYTLEQGEESLKFPVKYAH